ncbi:hypothetical protein E2C01_094325 [Portunus trituberculatus]|uniref:Uncharacterized protein n=1 Tax=Portunus trituberculatus TaxID=210409 RepID=A0A5B7K0H3_PORTR|nr:hypothetical protein [Portunus trituberculatus]
MWTLLLVLLICGRHSIPRTVRLPILVVSCTSYRLALYVLPNTRWRL